MRRTISAFLACLSLFLLIIGHSVSFAYGEDLEVILTTESSLEQSGSLIFTLNNLSPYAMKVLTWNTPLEGVFNSEAFSIYKEGERITYKGRLVKRGKPKESDYIIVESGSSVSATTSLPEGYDITSAGDYEVSFDGMIQYELVNAQDVKKSSLKRSGQKRKTSNKLVLEVISVPKPPATFKQVASYESCDAGQISVLEDVLTEAERIALEATAALTSTELADRATAGRYGSWFGDYTSTRYTAVTTHFTNISDALSDQTIEFLCDCSEEYYAYVYPNQPYEIHLCSQFWNAPISGTDSQSGTVIHEMSHFEVLVGTDDYFYGQENSLRLAAQVNPAEALDNADNHEYFAENVPYLPMEPYIVLNDEFSNSLVINDLEAYRLTVNDDAGLDPGEPQHAGNTGGKSLWFSWQAPATGTLDVSTIGSYLDTLLAVYTGTVISELSEIASDDDSGGTLQSAVSLSVTIGQTYHIAVDGYDGAAGMIYLALTAEFAEFTLSVNKTGTGTGTVSSSPAGIHCDTGCTSSSSDFGEDTPVTLTVGAADGSTFSGWSGACFGVGTCQVTMDSARSVSALFVADVPGDLNGNEEVDIGDAIIGLKILSNTSTEVDAIGDVDDDNMVGLPEVIYILGDLAD